MKLRFKDILPLLNLTSAPLFNSTLLSNFLKLKQEEPPVYHAEKPDYAYL